MTCAQFICGSCERTAIMNNDEMDSIWNEVLDFLDFMCNIPINDEIRNIPVASIDTSVLDKLIDTSMDEELNYSSHDEINCHGICLSEKADLDSSRNSIIGILCLRGLPKELTASILAHEAIHAWLKLHPLYGLFGPLPPIVEEGCCQLASYLYLEHKIFLSSKQKSVISQSEIELCQYIQYCIKHNTNSIYNEGFRMASTIFCSLKSQCKLTLGDLLNYVLIHNQFPAIST